MFSEIENHIHITRDLGVSYLQVIGNILDGSNSIGQAADRYI